MGGSSGGWGCSVEEDTPTLSLAGGGGGGGVHLQTPTLSAWRKWGGRVGEDSGLQGSPPSPPPRASLSHSLGKDCSLAPG